MKLQIALVLLGFCSLARAEIYKWVDPATGAVEFTNQPKRGATQMHSGDSPEELTGRVNLAKAAAELNKRWPGACVLISSDRWTCFPRVGMMVNTHDFILDLMPVGFSEDARGKVEHYRRASCRVTARKKLIIAVAC